jgi:CubicO group peptidase (beta-lactamase class C family)
MRGMSDDMPRDGSGRRIPRSSPEEQGVASSGLAALVQALQAGPPELRSIMVLRHGHVVAEGWAAPYGPDRPHALFSLSKTFTASAVGLAVGEGLVGLDDLVVDLLPDAVPAGGLSDDERARLGRLSVQHLLTMTTGHDEDTTPAVVDGRPDWLAGFLAQPLVHEPGTHFVYNTVATYALSAIVQRASGQRLLEYLRPRLLEPLGIVGATWEQSPAGIDVGGFGMSATTEDVAALGELLLRDGVWQGRRLLPEGWVSLASTAHVPAGTAPGDERSDWAQGYGFQVWRSRHGFRGDGAFGQYCLVLPEQDVVVVMTSAVQDLQLPLDAVWEHLLPALADRPLPADEPGQTALAQALGGLAVDWPTGAATSPTGARLDGRRIALDGEPFGIRALTVDVGADQDTLRFETAAGDVVLAAGHAAPAAGDVPPEYPGQPGPRPVLTSAVWPTPDEYLLTVRLLEDVTVLTARVVLDGDTVRISAARNVAFDDPELPPLVGHLT